MAFLGNAHRCNDGTEGLTLTVMKQTV